MMVSRGTVQAQGNLRKWAHDENRNRRLEWLLILLLVLGYAGAVLAQNGLNDLNYLAQFMKCWNLKFIMRQIQMKELFIFVIFVMVIKTLYAYVKI
jgi:hypothetical protein